VGYWNLYFAAKLYLAWIGSLRPAWWLNLLFAACLLIPVRHRLLRPLRHLAALAAGIALVLHEADLPAPSRILSQLPALSEFSPGYMLELAGRLVSPSLLWTVLLVFLAYLLINRWVRVTTFVLGALVAVPLWQGAALLTARAAPGEPAGTHARTAAGSPGANGQPAGSYDEQLAAFRAEQAERQVDFAPMSADPAAQFDIIVLHICSLSWDDMDVANLRNHPLLSRFDYVFSNFSSATSYSDPAAIRVLRASCGQQAHKDLFSPVPAECHLFAQLAAAGYRAQALLNHDGRYGDFKGIVESEIGIPGLQVLPHPDLPVVMREFDGSPLVGDYDALAQWYRNRLSQDGAPVALYYNTVTLHDGNRLPDSNLSSLQSYPIRLKTLLDDVDRLIDLIAQSGRKAAIVFVPEHGAALRGGNNQIAGMREIPTPQIVHVPVGVKLVGLPAGAQAGPQPGPVAVDAPTSYVALAQLLSGLVGNSPFQPGAPPLPQYAADLAQTRMVGENENTVTMATGNGYVIHTPDDVWLEGK